MPFRSARQKPVIDKPETGPVAEMVRQFADPYAFVRELVQNSIDAGATSLQLRVERASGIVTTSLQDNGSGMNRATIDGPLLTLFNSSKEGDSSKIGKYGVGFVSVFAIDPETVDIDTWRDEQRHRVRLYRDHRYELEKLEPRPASGTIVTLHQAMDAESFEQHRQRVEASVSRWCRFAAVPIEMTSIDHDRSEAPTVRRIDGPLAVPAALYVQAHRGHERIVVGPSAGADRFSATTPSPDDPAAQKATFAGFYNRGLTLFETEIPIHESLVNVRVRVDSPDLRHTLSRDNVLRDRAFDRIVEQAREIVHGPLRRELASRLAGAARHLARLKPPYDDELASSYLAFLEAATRKPLELPPKQIMFPLAAPWEEHLIISLEQVRAQDLVYSTFEPDDLSRALSRAGKPVVLAPHPEVVNLLSAHVPLPGPVSPNKVMVLVSELTDKELAPTDRTFCAAVSHQLQAAGMKISRVALARAGSEVDTLCMLVKNKKVHPVEAGKWLFPLDFAQRAWAEEKPQGALLLIEKNEAVRVAREHAGKDVFLAAHIFTRMILLSRLDEHGTISDTLFDSAAQEIA